MNRRDLIKSAVALALYGPRLPAWALLPRGSAQSMAAPSQSGAFPRTAALANGGDQSYSPVPYSSQVTDRQITSAGFFQESSYSNPVPWLGRFDIALIGGNYEGWDETSTYDRGLLVDAIQQICNVAGFVPASIWQYIDYDDRITNGHTLNAPEESFYPTIDNEKWLLYGAPQQAGTPVENFAGNGYTTNWAVAWPGTVNGVAADHGISPGRTTSPYDGLSEDFMQGAAAYFCEVYLARHSSFTGVVSGTISASAISDSRYYPNLVGRTLNDAMKAPNLGAFFVDNQFFYPRDAGYYDLANNYVNSATSAAAPWLARGHQHFKRRMDTLVSAAYPGRTIYRVGNFGSLLYYWQANGQSFTGLSNALQGYQDGGLLELFVSSAGFAHQYGTVTAIKAYQAALDFCSGPKQVALHGVMSSSTDYQTARYTLGITLMGDGFCVLNNGSYAASDAVWLDEFGGNPGTNTAKGWLGYRVGSRPTAAAVNGIWIAEFDHGVAICNPAGNGLRTITATQINTYLNGSYAYSYIQGVQDPATNPGGTFSQATLADADGLLLLKSGGGLAVTFTGSWDSGWSSSGVTVKSVGRDSAVQAGDLLLVWVTGNVDNNVSKVVDGQFGTLAMYSQAAQWNSTNSSWSQLFWAVATQDYEASSGNEVTANFSSSTGYAEVIAAQFRCSSGYIFEPTASVLGASVHDQSIAPGTGAGAITSGNSNFGTVPMLAFAGCLDITGDGGQTVANGWTSSFTGNGGNFVPAWSVITATGYQHASWTAAPSGGSDSYQAILVGLKITT